MKLQSFRAMLGAATLLIATLAASPAAAQMPSIGRELVTVGNGVPTFLTLPVPEGFQDPKLNNPKFRDRLAQMSTPPNQRLLLLGLRDADVAAVRAGTEPAMSMYFTVLVQKLLEDAKGTLKDFAGFKAIVKKQHATLADKVRGSAQNHLDSVADGLTKDTPGSPKAEFKLGEVRPMGEVEEGPDWVQFTMLVTTQVSANGQNETIVQASTATSVLVRGKLIALNVYRRYTGPQDAADNQRFVANWLQQLRAMNP